MNKTNTVVRHGDVVLYPVSASKVKGKVVKQNGKFVLAEGSTTGHKHVLTAKMEIKQDKKGVYLSLKADGKLTHEEHATITLPKGNYFVGQEREVDNFTKTVRQVVD